MYDLYWFFLSALTSQLYRSSVLRSCCWFILFAVCSFFVH